mmetsp:Transcript_68299/g.147332  ORF Transcript_68299/g.147332 Transcript_68299/m.147332 type:complete len:105 (-) Transcript_68299:87-401(-)
MQSINKHLNSIKDEVDLKKMVETDETFKELCEDFDIAENVSNEVFGDQMQNTIDDEEKQSLINSVVAEYQLETGGQMNSVNVQNNNQQVVHENDFQNRLNNLKN